jgi:hypothetical protein
VRASVEAKMKKSTASAKAIVLARAPYCWTFTASYPSSRPAPWPTSVTSPAWPTATGSLPVRHRTPRCLVRGAEPTPALTSEEPADEPHDPRRRDQQTRLDTDGRAYYRRKRAEGK